MGIDACIAFKESRIPINDLSYELGLRVGSQWFDHPIVRKNTYNSIWMVDIDQRYWGPGYERGYWPAIAATLEICMFYTKGLRYYGDVSDYDEIEDLNLDEFMKLHLHFLFGNHTYRTYNWFAKDKIPPKDMYGHDMVCNGGGGNKALWHSLASNERTEITYD